jgi:hypothetical protein
MIRQGDVLLVPRAPLTHNERKRAVPIPREAGRVVLAHGEVTGHAHAIADTETVLYELGGMRVVECGPGAALVHEEHTAHPLSGTYRVIRQREYTAGMVRRVTD